MSEKRGALIVFEGLDRSGKDTQVDLLVKYLGDRCVKLAFPNEKTEVGKMCRCCVNGEINLPDDSLHLLFSCNMLETIPEIKQLVKSGKVVVCSRYYYSAIAYSVARGLDYKWSKDVLSTMPEPDLFIFMDVDPVQASKREGYGEGRYEILSFQEKVRDSYYRVADDTNPQCRMTLDAGRSADEIREEIVNGVDMIIENVSNGLVVNSKLL